MSCRQLLAIFCNFRDVVRTKSHRASIMLMEPGPHAMVKKERPQNVFIPANHHTMWRIKPINVSVSHRIQLVTRKRIFAKKFSKTDQSKELLQSMKI